MSEAVIAESTSNEGSKAPKPGEKLQVVPEYLKNFVLNVAKTFYGREHFAIIDYIQRNVCVKEEKLRQAVKFDNRSLKPFIQVLKVDKIIKERVVTEEIDGKQKKVPYYHVNYKGIINVTKYKLDQIRQKLESKEKEQVYKATYKCSGCEMRFDQLEVGKLWDPAAGIMKCWTCYSEVLDEDTAGPSEDTRSSLAKFNEQMEFFVSVMQNLNGVIFADCINEPPVPTTIDGDDRARDGGDGSGKARVVALGERFFNPDAPKFSVDMMKLNLGGDNDNVEDEKEAVPWLVGSVRVPLADVERREAVRKSREAKKSSAKLRIQDEENEDEIDTLLQLEQESQENRPKRKAVTLDDLKYMVAQRNSYRVAPPPAKKPRFTLGDDDDDDGSTNGQRRATKQQTVTLKEKFRQDLTVQINGKAVYVNEVTRRMFDVMTPDETEAYYLAYERLMELVYRVGW